MSDLQDQLREQLKKGLSLDEWYRVEGDVWVFQRPAKHIRQQGLIQAILLPVVLVFCWALLTALGSEDSNGVLIVGALWGVVLSVPGVIGVALGARKVLRCEAMSEASRAELDTRDATGRLRVRQPNGLIKFIALEHLVGSDVRTLLGRVPPTHGPELAALGERLAQASGLEFVDAGVGSMDRLGMSDKTAAMLCWLPFQGIWFLASVYYLFMGKDRPFVRSSAIQSLAWFGVTLMGLFLGAVMLAPAVALDTPLFAIPGGLVMSVFALGNLVVRGIGCWKGYRGEPWVAPGLRPLMVRLLPPRDDL